MNITDDNDDDTPLFDLCRPRRRDAETFGFDPLPQHDYAKQKPWARSAALRRSNTSIPYRW